MSSNWPELAILFFFCTTFQLLFHNVSCQLQKVYEVEGGQGHLLTNYSSTAVKNNHHNDRSGNGNSNGDVMDGKEEFSSDYELEKIRVRPVVAECFTCHYTKKESFDFGMSNCDERFDRRGIPTVTCEGFCATTKSILGYEQYMIIRSCLPNCRNIYDEVTNVECCFGNLCNGLKSAATGLLRSNLLCICFLSRFILDIHIY